MKAVILAGGLGTRISEDSTRQFKVDVRNIAKLKAAGRLQRIGSKKSGHWKVIG